MENIVNDPRDYQLIHNIISIGKNQGCTLVAEGVDTIEQVDILKKLGCEHFQGYYYSKPIKPKELLNFIKSN